MIFSENRFPPRIKSGAGLFGNHALRDRPEPNLLGLAISRKVARTAGSAACIGCGRITAVPQVDMISGRRLGWIAVAQPIILEEDDAGLAGKLAVELLRIAHDLARAQALDPSVAQRSRQLLGADDMQGAGRVEPTQDRLGPVGG